MCGSLSCLCISFLVYTMYYCGHCCDYKMLLLLLCRRRRMVGQTVAVRTYWAQTFIAHQLLCAVCLMKHKMLVPFMLIILILRLLYLCLSCIMLTYVLHFYLYFICICICISVYFFPIFVQYGHKLLEAITDFQQLLIKNKNLARLIPTCILYNKSKPCCLGELFLY